MSRLCPHNEMHDRIRDALGYVRDARDGHRSVCALCWVENAETVDGRFHSPHGAVVCLVWSMMTMKNHSRE